MQKLLVWLVLALLVTGCNTISGVGKDIEAGGKKIRDAAEHKAEHQPEQK